MDDSRRAPPLGRLLGAGKEAEVFEYKDRVAKLYKPHALKRSVFREAAILAFVESLGLPTPAVSGVREFDGRWGVIMDRIDGPLFAEAMRRDLAAVPAYLNAMAALHRRIHAQPAAPLANLKAKLAANIERTTLLRETLRADLLERLAAMPDGDRLCHGDFHPMNILGKIGRETIVDWLDASRGDPAADVCRSYVLIKPRSDALASAYVDVYAKISGVSRKNVLRWLPFVAAARLAEGVEDEAEGLMQMAAAASSAF
ncbi:MAG TPA: aminoglycoside phosphotransferase family protein [Roseiarcus sp.]|nr:aminoglycoside phosphotransferase family protein [Roseiarcus sp.]